MENGQQIVLKKLSMGSRQGMHDFLNEVRLLLKVQHRNWCLCLAAVLPPVISCSSIPTSPMAASTTFSLVLGTPTREKIQCMKRNYTMFGFPQIKAHHMHKVLELGDSAREVEGSCSARSRGTLSAIAASPC